VFESRVLRKILGPKRDVVTGEGRRLHNEELNDLYSSQIEKNEMGTAYSTYGGKARCIQDFGRET
jgi:hypothetical protein